MRTKLDFEKIIMARFPKLRPYPDVVTELVKRAQIDHIYSAGVDAPENLVVDFKGARGPASDCRAEHGTPT